MIGRRASNPQIVVSSMVLYSLVGCLWLWVAMVDLFCCTPQPLTDLYLYYFLARVLCFLMLARVQAAAFPNDPGALWHNAAVGFPSMLIQNTIMAIINARCIYVLSILER